MRSTRRQAPLSTPSGKQYKRAPPPQLYPHGRRRQALPSTALAKQNKSVFPPQLYPHPQLPGRLGMLLQVPHAVDAREGQA